MKQRSQTIRIRQFIIDNVDDHPTEIVRIAATKFSLARQSIQAHISALIGEGAVEATGNTRSRRYSLRPIKSFSIILETQGLQEDIPWRDTIRPQLDGLPQNVIDIAEYGFLEMLNNVIDHSNSSKVWISLTSTLAGITVSINDIGIGIFRKIMTEFKLPDEVSAIWELVKGKLTTDPKRHSGEGVFFTSRMCDYFSLLSGSLFFFAYGA